MTKLDTRAATSTLILSLCLLLSQQAFAQGSAADYRRADELAGKTRDKVFRTRVQPNWLDAHHFWYRVDVGRDKYRFVLVDALQGTRQDAFDHDRMAELLADVSGNEVSADRLPFREIQFSDDGSSLQFTVKGKGWRCDLADYSLNPAEAGGEASETTVDVLGYPRPSDRTGDETRVVFINRTAGKVKLYWLSTGGGRTLYAEIAPAGEHDQHTFGGHVWLALDEGENPVGVFAAKDSEGVAVIDGNWRPGRRRGDGSPSGRRGGGGPDRPSGNRSPNGRWEVKIVEHNVVLRDVNADEESTLTDDGTEADMYQSRVYWAPDSQKFVVMQERQGEERQISFIESSPKDQVQPKLHTFTYVKPGDAIDQSRPRLFDVADKRQIEVPEELFANPWSISDVRWDADSRRFTFLYNQRGHQVLRVVAVDAATGQAQPLVDEVSETFVCYSSKTFFRRLEDTNEILWMSERDGWNHLYLYDAGTGQVKNPITRGPWVVRSVDRVDEANRQVWFQAGGIHPGQDPYYLHFCRINFDGSGLVVLTQGDGSHEIEYSPDREFFVDTYSRVDLPPVTELRRTDDGSLVCELERGDWSELLATGWQPPEPFAAQGRDGQTDIYGVIYRPTHFDPQKKYPVIEAIYAGPHSAHVPKSFSAYRGQQAIAELGFVVVQIDGMGTSHRSKAFHDVCWQNLADAGFPDRICWMQAAAEQRPWMDISRVGIFGGSAGGQNAMGALLWHGDFYDAAAADCGCHDNRMDKIWWNEQWMGWPVGPHYEQSSNVTNAHRLQGKLLLIVGEMDRNVDPASTMQVVDALIKADKDFELIVVPGAGHGAGGGAYGQRRQRDFFVRNLLGVEPRWQER